MTRIRTARSSRTRQVMLGMLPAVALVTLCSSTAPVQAAAPADIRHQEIVNKADGGRMDPWNDSAVEGSVLSTIREPNSDYEQRTGTQWELDRQGDGSWLVRSEKNTTLCLQPASEPRANVRIVLRRCSGDRGQTWRIVPERTDSSESTGWWSLRPVENTRLAAAPLTVGTAYSEVRLFRATNSSDRLWHHQPEGQSW